MLRALTSIVFALAVLTADARGQVAPPAQDSANARLVPGVRVRVSASSLGRRVSGHLALAPDQNLVIVAADGRTLTVPASSVERLEVSAGTRHHGGLGLAIGLGVGLVAGVAGGAVIGHRIGRAFKSERWEPEAPEPAAPEPLRIGFTWVEGPGVAVSMRW